jgi:hypothetical protein
MGLLSICVVARSKVPAWCLHTSPYSDSCHAPTTRKLVSTTFGVAHHVETCVHVSRPFSGSHLVMSARLLHMLMMHLSEHAVATLM